MTPAGYSDTTSENEDRAYRTDTGVDIKSISGGYAVTKMASGEYIEFSVNVASETTTACTFAQAPQYGCVFKSYPMFTNLVDKFDARCGASGLFKTYSVGKIHLKPGVQKNSH